MLDPKQNKIIHNNSGQVFLEFILLLLVMVTISYGFMAGMNKAIGARWRAIVTIVARPTDTPIKMR